MYLLSKELRIAEFMRESFIRKLEKESGFNMGAHEMPYLQE